MLKVLWRLVKEARKQKGFLIIAILSTLALTAINLAAPNLLKVMTALVEKGVDDASFQKILSLTLGLVILYLTRILFRYLSNFMAHRAAWYLVADIRIRVYEQIQSLSLSFFHNKQTGDLMSRVVNDTATFELLYAHIIPEMITNVITFIGVTIILLTYNVKLALLTCIPIPLIAISGWIFSTKIRPNFRAAQRTIADLNSTLQDNFSGIHEIQAFGQEEMETTVISEKTNNYTNSILRALNLSAIFHPSVEFLTGLGTVIVVGFGGYLAYLQQIDVSTIVGFLLYLSLFYAPITGLAKTLEDTQQAFAGAERVIDILDAKTDIIEAKNAYDLKNIQGEIQMDHVDFSYEEDVPVLKDIHFTCKPGQMIALVGPTGVGKTTITQMISRFYDPVKGTVRIDGHDLRDVTLQSLRANIAPVLQDTFLFNATICDNILFADPNASREDVIAAAKAAQIHETIMEMPEGYDTKVGERGMKLSGGQKQRIAIARAILRKAPIIILDEATASVDVETEAQIQKAIQDLAGKRTIVAIAHRLSTIQKADIILVFEDGMVVQQGTHEELLKEEGLYQRLCKAQSASTFM